MRGIDVVTLDDEVSDTDIFVTSTGNFGIPREMLEEARTMRKLMVKATEEQ